MVINFYLYFSIFCFYSIDDIINLAYSGRNELYYLNMSDKTPGFYYNQQLLIKEICDRIKEIVLILRKQKNEIEIRQARQSLKNYSDNYEKK